MLVKCKSSRKTMKLSEVCGGQVFRVNNQNCFKLNMYCFPSDSLNSKFVCAALDTGCKITFEKTTIVKVLEGYFQEE